MFARPFNLQLFAADPGSGGGDPTPSNTAPTPNPAPTPSAGSDPTPPGNEPKPITFPDAAAFHARVARESKAELTKQFKELGFESYEAGMEALKAAIEAQNAAKSDLDKAREEAAKAARERDDAKSIAENALRKATFVAQATAAGVPADRIDDAYLLLSKDDIKVDLASGTVEGMDDAVKALLEAKPWLKGDASGATPPGTSAGNSGRASGSAAPTPQEKGKQWAEIHGTVSRSTVGYRPPEWGPAPGSKNS